MRIIWNLVSWNLINQIVLNCKIFCKIIKKKWFVLFKIYGAFAIEREETTGKNKKWVNAKSGRTVFQRKKHIWHIKVNLVFPGSFPPFYCKGPIYISKTTVFMTLLSRNYKTCVHTCDTLRASLYYGWSNAIYVKWYSLV